MGLKFAACLGPNFDASVLEKVKKDNESGGSFLKSCVDFGFLQKSGPSQYVWSHDQVQQAGTSNVKHFSNTHIVPNQQ